MKKPRVSHYYHYAYDQFFLSISQLEHVQIVYYPFFEGGWEGGSTLHLNSYDIQALLNILLVTQLIMK